MNNIYIIPLILSTILGLYVFVLSYAYFIDSNHNINKNDWLKIIFTSIVIIINGIFSPTFLSGPFSVFIQIFLYKWIFNDNLKKLIFLSIFIGLLGLVPDFILLLFFNTLENSFSLTSIDIILNRVISTLLFAYIYYFIFRLNFFKLIFKNLYHIFKNKKQSIIMLGLIFALIVSFCALFSNKINLNQVYLIALLELVIVFGICFFYFKEARINLDLRIKNNYLNENKVLFEQHLEQYQLLKHNLINDLIFIKSLCPNDIQEVINDKIKKFTVNNDILTNIKHVPEGLQGVIYIKSCVAKHKNIKFYVNNKEVNNLDFKNNKYYIELCEVLSELLDNSIEASKKTKDKIIYIDITKDYKCKRIKIINTFSNEIHLNKIGEKNYTTKQDGSGIGLYYISNLNKNIKISRKIINNLFVTEIKIDLKHLLLK